MEVVEKTLDERSLSTSRNDTNLHSQFLNLLHEWNYAIEDFGNRHIVKDMRLYIVHLLRLIE